MRTPPRPSAAWLLPALSACLFAACSHDCGDDPLATAQAAAGKDLIECGHSYYGTLGCETTAAAAQARQCFFDAAKACEPAHLGRSRPSQDGPLEENLYVVRSGTACKIHVVQQFSDQFCADPVRICDSATPTVWVEEATHCLLATPVGCTGGPQ